MCIRDRHYRASVWFIPFFHQLTYRSDPSTDFYGWWLKRRELEQGCAFWGFVVIAVYFGVKSPENLIFGGRESAFSSQTGNILKVACYRNYYIDFNQILHNDRDHKVVVVGGPNRRPRNPRWRTAAILKKNRWIAISLQSFDRFWWDLVQWRILPPYSGCAVKISNFWTSKMAAAAIFKKITNKCYISATVWPIFTKFGRLMQNGSLNRSYRQKSWISQIQDGAWPPFWKPLNCHISATVWPILMKFGTVTHTGSLHQIDR